MVCDRLLQWVEVTRFGKGDELQRKADARRKAHTSWVNAQLNRAQEQRDWAHKREVRKFYAEKRKKAKARRVT